MVNNDTFNAFFVNDNTKRKIRTFLQYLRQVPPSSEFENQRNAHMTTMLESMVEAAEQWDKNCQINIDWIGYELLETISAKHEYTKEQLDDAFAILYRFLFETYLSIKQNLSIELNAAREFAQNKLSNFDKPARDQIVYAHTNMPIHLLKQIASNEAVINLKKMDSVAKEATNKIETWAKELNEYEGRALFLKNTLDNYKTAFNFVGLHQGFEDLSEIKEAELKKTRFWTITIGALVPTPIFAKSIYLLASDKTLNWDLSTLIGFLPTVSLVVIFIYYFRIFLLEYKSLKAQLLQLELRKTLCRFIQSYCDYSKEIKTKDKDALDRFERIIFSNIVSDDEDIPSAYDGVEQLIKLIKPTN